MKILIATDHAGFELKEKIKDFLVERGYDVKDFGAYKFEENDDYPDFVIPLAKEISNNSDLKGVILGGSGQGEAICANRFKGVRAVVFNGQYKPEDGREVPNEIILSREHNDANILSLGARFLNLDEAKRALDLWLNTPYGEEKRHLTRIQKIDRINQ
jgi:ribose 5-phosphate isomerase B